MDESQTGEKISTPITRIEELNKFVMNFTQEHDEDPKFIERQEFWLERMKDIRQAEKNGKISPEIADFLRGSMITIQEYLASHDGLTGFYNQREFNNQLIKACANAQRYREDITLIIVDVDGLKLVNEGPGGHPAGNRAIQDVAGSIERNIGMNDDPARWGGDEFAIICRTTVEGGKLLANRILEDLRTTTQKEGRPITASIGVGQLKLDKGMTAEQYFKNVDDALKIAKQQGKDQVYKLDV